MKAVQKTDKVVSKTRQQQAAPVSAAQHSLN